MKTCAIVILNYNGREMLERFLPSICQCSSYDIWVVDNASSDDSLAVLSGVFPAVHLIHLSENFGYAGGYNWGLEQLKGKYEFYILVNSDVEVSPNWDLSLIGFLQKKEDYVAVQPKILSVQNPDFFDYAGAAGGFLDSLYYPYCRGRIWNVIEQDRGQYEDSIEVDWASGACFALRARHFHEAGGFDAHFFAHMEEIDLCLRWRRKGWKIGFSAESVVYHLGGATLDRSSPRKLYLNIRNSLRMIAKNEGAARFFLIFLLKAGMEFAAGMGYLISGKREMFVAVFEAYWDFWKSRHLVEKTNHLGPKPIKKGPVDLIFWNFLVLRKKYFSNL
ncbi:glycosyltransferase family 2 protein [Algoriphagus sp.]|uniref:glycosyltransferase family 2 protein n=1 Tax=Algoriphagus sp. TaxID=1872435 RepID=UPI002638630A|nr:glycosyltransferase family 2 protein [Algoriphagus sp.]